MRKLFYVLTLAFFFFNTNLALADALLWPLKELPIQDAGRIKPLDTFARESLQLLHGRQTYKGRYSIDILFTMLLAPTEWDKTAFIPVDHLALKKGLHLDLETKYFSPIELLQNDRLGLVMQELQSARQAREKLGPFEQAVQRLENQLGLYMAIKSGEALRLNPADNAWLGLNKIEPDLGGVFADMTNLVTEIISLEMQKNSDQLRDKQAQLNKLSEQFATLVRAHSQAKAVNYQHIHAEVFYNSTQPFHWAWIFYGLAAIGMAVAWIMNRPAWLKWIGWPLVVAGFVMHNLGFALRIYLMERPPVSNMYESVVWVAWGVIVFAMIFTLVNKRYINLIAGALVATLCLLVADFAPTIFDASMQPLEPVLRSNLWLIIHVMTITLSYAAFFLAFGLGDYGLYLFARGRNENDKRLREVADSIYRAVQAGIVLLAAGTILGGVWADYSWGRFWGWDPKETWAFIALMGYLVLLHGRLAGWLKVFGMCAGAVIAFSLVIMAWYGVNYVLGAGLHSYGFGAGGVEYVAGFVCLHILFVILCFYLSKTNRASASN